MDVRWIFDEPGEGAWNMALDEALLESAAAGGMSTFRVYRWSEPTLSLGYFQTYEDRHSHPPSLPCAVVRRQSGGGAILHDHEWTYSFTASINDRISSDVQALFQAIHGSFVQTLRVFGVSAEMWETETAGSRTTESFLCFQRRAKGDIVIAEHKVVGSAQRRRHHAVLQHGSILWERSEFAPELPGVKNLTENLIGADTLLKEWREQLQDTLRFHLIPGVATQGELQRASQIAKDRYRSAAWITRR